MSTAASPTFPRGADVNPKPLGVALLLIIVGAWYLAQTVGAKHAALFVVGALLGLALYHAAFGFTSAWRVFIADGRGAGCCGGGFCAAIAGMVTLIPSSCALPHASYVPSSSMSARSNSRGRSSTS